MRQIVIILVSLISSAGRKKYRYKVNEIFFFKVILILN